jgi:hypothetical protein
MNHLSVTRQIDTETVTSPLRSMSHKAVTSREQNEIWGIVRHSSVLGMMAGGILGGLVWIL